MRLLLQILLQTKSWCMLVLVWSYTVNLHCSTLILEFVGTLTHTCHLDFLCGKPRNHVLKIVMHLSAIAWLLHIVCKISLLSLIYNLSHKFLGHLTPCRRLLLTSFNVEKYHPPFHAENTKFCRLFIITKGEWGEDGKVSQDYWPRL